jgi:metallo-beta-lactamase class B
MRRGALLWALVKEPTSAQYMAMQPDVVVTEDGGKSDFFYGKAPGSLYRPMKVDRVLNDGDEVKLGGSVLTAHLTPGHTKGCTTWTMKVSEGGKTYDVVIVGRPNVNAGVQLVNNAPYPQIADDYQRTFRVLKSLDCDIFLGAHGDYYGLGKVRTVDGGRSQRFHRSQWIPQLRGGQREGLLERMQRQKK